MHSMFGFDCTEMSGASGGAVGGDAEGEGESEEPLGSMYQILLLVETSEQANAMYVVKCSEMQ